ncbi:MAG: hypothetical protein IKE49_02460 [Firmicutes bacterium]|nr:hypothetical protein [Bacillota bacterium]
MFIDRSVDIEDEVRMALDDYLTVYCRPLPASYTLPNILVSQVGGSDADKIDTFEVVLDARGETEGSALLTLRNAVGILRKAAEDQTTAIRFVQVVSSGSWGRDPVRPDLAMCSARVRIVAHLEKIEL